MKKECLQIGFLILVGYMSWKIQPAMARHTHHHSQLACHHCPPGFGVHHLCTHHRDTECKPCEADHYSSHRSAHRPCYPCSRCGLGLYVAHPCSATNDTVCDSCHTYKGPHNNDFYERCVKPLLEVAEERSSTKSTLNYADPLITVDRTRGVPPSVVIASGIAIGALSVILIVTCVVASSKRQCKRVDCRYPYEAVATQEAVML